MEHSVVVGSQAHQKAVNVSIVMQQIRVHPGVSRTEIAETTGLTKSTISNIVRELVGRRLVVEQLGDSEKSAGRPRIGLALASNAVSVAGVEFRRDVVSVVVVGLDGKVLARQRRTLGEVEHAEIAGWRAVHEILESVRSEHLYGVGLAIPATTDPYEGRVVEAFDFDDQWEIPRVIRIAGRELPVVLENDANSVAWGELYSLQTREAETSHNVIVVTGRYSTEPPRLRVGTGIVIGNRVYYGADFAAGEFRGSTWREGSVGELGRNDGTTRGCIVELLSELSVAASMLRPQRIVLSGDLSREQDTVERVLREDLAGSFIDPSVSGIPIEVAAERRFSVAAGAAYMFLAHLFAVPEVDRRRPLGVPQWEEISIDR